MVGIFPLLIETWITELSSFSDPSSLKKSNTLVLGWGEKKKSVSAVLIYKKEGRKLELGFFYFENNLAEVSANQAKSFNP